MLTRAFLFNFLRIFQDLIIWHSYNLLKESLNSRNVYTSNGVAVFLEAVLCFLKICCRKYPRLAEAPGKKSSVQLPGANSGTHVIASARIDWQYSHENNIGKINNL